MPDYKKISDDQQETGISIQELVKLAEEQLMLQKLVKDLEESLRKRKEDLKNLQTEVIPKEMKKLGMQSFTLSDGSTISIEKKYFASIPKDYTLEAMHWLEENGYGDTVKRVIQAQQPRDNQKTEELKEWLFDNEINFDINQSIHHSTLKKIVKDTMEAGKDIPIKAFGVYVENSSNIK